jgi:two-component system, LuxR family, sensor kinase FixL
MSIETSPASTVSEARLASVLDTAVFGIIVADQSGRILVYNKACEQLFGWTAEEVHGQNLKIIMPPHDAGQHDKYIRNYLDTGEAKIIGIGREVHGRHRDGTVFPLQLAVGDAPTPEGRQFIGILRDLRSEFDAAERLDALQAQLVRMARINAVDEMGAALAHELNQPLTAVMLYLQAVHRAAAKRTGPEALPREISEILEKTLAEAGRAGQIIHRMRRFIEKRESVRQAADLAMLTQEAVEFTVIGSKAREVTIEPRIADNVPPVEVDPVQIQQIIVNLLRNAMEAVGASKRKEITIEIARRGDVVALSVEDTGPGVAPDIAPQLFRAFATGARGGVGLGLAISKSIAQSHGGDLSVDPGGAGRGARFTLELPVMRAGDAVKGG